MSYEKNIQYQKLHKENHTLLDPPSLYIFHVGLYWLWLIKNYNVCLASSGRNLVSKVGMERGDPPLPPPKHAHSEHGLHHRPAFFPQGEKKGRLTINNSIVHVTFQLHQTSKYSINTDSKLSSTYPVVTLYIKETVKELLFTTQLGH